MKRMGTSLALSLALVMTACSGGAGGGGGGTPAGGGTGAASIEPVQIVVWHTQAGSGLKLLGDMASEFERQHPGITIKLVDAGNASYGLQKLETSMAGGKYPDMAYLYGMFTPAFGTAPQALDLRPFIQKDPSFDWEDFWPAEREAATVNGKVVAVPALVDNLALVYNKDLFDEAGLAYPDESWTWEDFRSAAKALTDPEKKQYGWSIVSDGSESTVWRFDPLLWQAGADVLTADKTQAAFNSPEGMKAFELLDQMVNVDRSVYLDHNDSTSFGVFTSGNMGMFWTGPWDLPGIIEAKMNYGVTMLPGNHATVSGPDNWVLLDNGPARAQATWEWVRWFTAAEQDSRWMLETGELPIRESVMELPEYQTYVDQYPGIDTWVENMKLAHTVPHIESYPKVSEAEGQAVLQVLYDKMSPEEAANSGAEQVNSILATSG